MVHPNRVEILIHVLIKKGVITEQELEQSRLELTKKLTEETKQDTQMPKKE